MQTFEKYIKIIHQDFPRLVISSIKKLGEGDNNKAYLINEEYIFRFPKRERVKKQVRREIAVLSEIKSFVNIQIPELEYISPSINFIGYRMIKGENFSANLFHKLGKKDQQNAQKALADFLSSVHAIDLSQLKNCNLKTMNLKEEYKDNFEKAKQLIFPHLSKNKRNIITRFFLKYLTNEHNFDYSECLIHNDFSSDHILFNTVKKQITGIIDFGDIAIGDPDYDLMYLLDEFGEKFIPGFLKNYPQTKEKNLLQKLNFFALANKIQSFPDKDYHAESDLWKYAYAHLNEWFEKQALQMNLNG